MGWGGREGGGGWIITVNKGIGFESRSEPTKFSGHFSSSVFATFASFILSLIATAGHLFSMDVNKRL